MLSRIGRRLTVIMMAGVALFFLVGAFNNRISVFLLPIVGDAMDRQSRHLMGPSGIDCGTVKVHADPKAATDCALEAQAEGKPFRVRYDVMGYDSEVAGGIVRTREGKLYALSFDGDISGQGGTSLFRERVTRADCPQPIHLWVNPKGRINCFQQQLSPPSGITSPNFRALLVRQRILFALHSPSTTFHLTPFSAELT